MTRLPRQQDVLNRDALDVLPAVASVDGITHSEPMRIVNVRPWIGAAGHRAHTEHLSAENPARRTASISPPPVRVGSLDNRRPQRVTTSPETTDSTRWGRPRRNRITQSPIMGSSVMVGNLYNDQMREVIVREQIDGRMVERVEMRPDPPPNRGPDPSAECICGGDAGGARSDIVCPKHDGTFYI